MSIQTSPAVSIWPVVFSFLFVLLCIVLVYSSYFIVFLDLASRNYTAGKAVVADQKYHVHNYTMCVYIYIYTYSVRVSLSLSIYIYIYIDR